VIRQRVDASGVSEAQISRQGGQNIVVSLPGKPSQATLELVRTSAVMYFRPVLRVLEGSAQQAAKNIASQNPSGAPTSAPTSQPSAQAQAQPDPNAGGEATQPPADSTGAEEGSGEGEQATPTPAPTAQPTAQSTAPRDSGEPSTPTRTTLSSAMDSAPFCGYRESDMSHSDPGGRCASNHSRLVNAAVDTLRADGSGVRALTVVGAALGACTTLTTALTHHCLLVCGLPHEGA